MKCLRTPLDTDNVPTLLLHKKNKHFWREFESALLFITHRWRTLQNTYYRSYSIPYTVKNTDSKRSMKTLLAHSTLKKNTPRVRIIQIVTDSTGITRFLQNLEFPEGENASPIHQWGYEMMKLVPELWRERIG